MDQLTQEYLSRMLVPRLYWQATLELIEGPQKSILLKFIQNFTPYVHKGWGLYLFGEYESGKSAAAAVLLKEGVIKNGLTGLWVVADDIPAFVIDKAIPFDEDESMYERMLRVDVLIIDELILKSKERFAETAIESIFRKRLCQMKSTIFTSNISTKRLAENYPALQNVMTEAVFPVEFTGKFRKKKAEEMARDLNAGI